MSKSKRDKMKAKEKRHTAPLPPSARQNTESDTRPIRAAEQDKKKNRNPRRWLGLSNRDWLWIALAVIVAIIAAFLIWWFLLRTPSEAPTPTEATTTTTSIEKGSRTLAATNPGDRVNYYSSPPEMQIDASRQFVATFNTSKGDIVIELYADKVPTTVNNFVFLANEGYYDNTVFHRVITGFMAQGGDPSGTGRGGPGYRFSDEFHPDLRHDGAGVLSMANAGPGTNGSQFFITFAPQPHLDDMHSVFGRVVEGSEDVLSQVKQGDSLVEVTIEER